MTEESHQVGFIDPSEGAEVLIFPKSQMVWIKQVVDGGDDPVIVQLSHRDTVAIIALLQEALRSLDG